MTTQELPLAPNLVRLDTQARGGLFVGQAADKTMRRSAELTIEKDFTHFRLDQAQMERGQAFGGMYTSGTATATYGSGWANGSASSVSTPIMVPTAEIGVTVVMFHANEPGALGAFDAKQVIADLDAKK